MADDVVAENRPIVTLDEARKAGLKRYFTGKPCSHGHIEERQTSSRGCFACHRAKNEKNKEYHCRKSKEWDLANVERKKRLVGEWYRNNKNRKLETTRAWREANPERHKTTQAAWWRANPEKAVAFAAVGRSRRVNADGSFTKEDILRLLRDQEFKCAACAVSISHWYHVDHVMPLARGGSNWPDNLQLLCPPCNLSKGSLTMDEWRPKLICTPA